MLENGSEGAGYLPSLMYSVPSRPRHSREGCTGLPDSPDDPQPSLATALLSC